MFTYHWARWTLWAFPSFQTSWTLENEKEKERLFTKLESSRVILQHR